MKNMDKNLVFFAENGLTSTSANHIANMAKEFPNISFYKVNVDRESILARKMNIQSIPTVMFYKQGQLVNQFAGYKNPQEIKTIISNFLK